MTCLDRWCVFVCVCVGKTLRRSNLSHLVAAAVRKSVAGKVISSSPGRSRNASTDSSWFRSCGCGAHLVRKSFEITMMMTMTPYHVIFILVGFHHITQGYLQKGTTYSIIDQLSINKALI